MSWGYKIMLVYLTFVSGIMVAVYKSTQQNIDLVTTDYYAKELKFQDHIEAVKRTNALSSKVTYTVNDRTITISLPAEFTAQQVTGNVVLYYPADDNGDVKKAFITNDNSIKVALPPSAKGSYQLQLSWVSGGKDYYFEENLFL